MVKEDRPGRRSHMQRYWLANTALRPKDNAVRLPKCFKSGIHNKARPSLTDIQVTERYLNTYGSSALSQKYTTSSYRSDGEQQYRPRAQDR